MVQKPQIIPFFYACFFLCHIGCAIGYNHPSTDTPEQIIIIEAHSSVSNEDNNAITGQQSHPVPDSCKQDISKHELQTKSEEKETESEPVKELLEDDEQKQEKNTKEGYHNAKPDANNEPSEKDLEDITEDLIDPETKIKEPTYYDKCDYIFKTYVDENGLVDYDTLRRKRIELITAAKEFDNINPMDMLSWSNEEKISLWINAYNIFTLKLIVDNYPIQPHWIFRLRYPENSIMQIPGAWTKNYFKVMGMEYTLREIEREIILTRFKDPRICFALSNATKGGAFLRNECYRANILDKQLQEQVSKYLSTPKGFIIDPSNNYIYISNIFNTQKDTFVEKYGEVKRFRTRKKDIRSFLNFITEYVSKDNIKYFESERYSIKFIEFDWHLNEQPLK